MARKRTPSRPADARPRVVGYVRVSTTGQADHGVSLAAQEAKLRAYADLYDLDLCEIIVDAGLSAKSLDRPGLQRGLALLADGKADALLVASLSRLTRSVKDLGTLVECYFGPKGAALVSVSESLDTRTAAGRLVLNILGSVAEWERSAIGERTSAAMRHMASKGEFTGGRAPYGHALTADGSLVAHEGEQRAIARARALDAEGRSLRSIAATLASEGHAPRNGGTFAPVQVSRMLRGEERSAA